jgi:hypothetical protein
MKNKKNRIFFISLLFLFLITALLTYLIVTNHPGLESWQMQVKCERFTCHQDVKITINNQNFLPVAGLISLKSPDMEKYDPEKFKLSVLEEIPLKKWLENQKPFLQKHRPDKILFFFCLLPGRKTTLKFSAVQTAQGELSLPEIRIKGRKPEIKRQYRIELDPAYQNIENSFKLKATNGNSNFEFDLPPFETGNPVFRWKYRELIPIFSFMG